MSEEQEFQSLIRRLRAGDPDAAAELVKGYEPAIRRMVRMRMRDSRLRRAFDSMDICQSVFGSFFIRAAMGQFDLDKPGNLIGLLATMARRKVAEQARKPQVQRREFLDMESGGADERRLLATDSTPSMHVAHRDFLDEFRKHLSPGERRLAELRSQERSWDEIATELGGQPDALRKQLSRALDRVAVEMGVEKDDAM